MRILINKSEVLPLSSFPVDVVIRLISLLLGPEVKIRGFNKVLT